MTQGVIEAVLLMGLVGLIWVIVLDILGDYHHTHDKRQAVTSLEQRNGYEPQDAHPGSQRLRPDKEA